MLRSRQLVVALAFVSSLLGMRAEAGLLSSVDPEVFRSSYNGFIGGTASCNTRGTYDANTFLWMEVGACNGTGLVEGDLSIPGSNTPGVFTQATMAALVDNSRNVLGGGFALFGRIEGLGMYQNTLLAAGRLLDVAYRDAPILAGQPTALIELDYMVDPLQHLGTLMLWSSNASVAGWTFGPGWNVSADLSSYHNFTGSQYFFYDRDILSVPEPGTLLLISLCIFLLWPLRARKVRARA